MSFFTNMKPKLFNESGWITYLSLKNNKLFRKNKQTFSYTVSLKLNSSLRVCNLFSKSVIFKVLASDSALAPANFSARLEFSISAS